MQLIAYCGRTPDSRRVPRVEVEHVAQHQPAWFVGPRRIRPSRPRRGPRGLRRRTARPPAPRTVEPHEDGNAARPLGPSALRELVRVVASRVLPTGAPTPSWVASCSGCTTRWVATRELVGPFLTDRHTSWRTGSMLHWVEKPTRQPSISSPARSSMQSSCATSTSPRSRRNAMRLSVPGHPGGETQSVGLSRRRHQAVADVGAVDVEEAAFRSARTPGQIGAGAPGQREHGVVDEGARPRSRPARRRRNARAAGADARQYVAAVVRIGTGSTAPGRPSEDLGGAATDPRSPPTRSHVSQNDSARIATGSREHHLAAGTLQLAQAGVDIVPVVHGEQREHGVGAPGTGWSRRVRPPPAPSRALGDHHGRRLSASTIGRSARNEAVPGAHVEDRARRRARRGSAPRYCGSGRRWAAFRPMVSCAAA